MDDKYREVKAKVNDFVEKYGTGYRTVSGEPTEDQTIINRLAVLLSGKKVIEAIGGILQIGDSIMDEFEEAYFNVILECMKKYDAAFDGKKNFFDYLVLYMGYEKKNILMRLKRRGDMKSLDDESVEEIQTPETAERNELYQETLLDFISSMVQVVKGLKRAKYDMYRIFYTELFLVLCEYDRFEIEGCKHKRDILEELDHAFIQFLYRVTPETISDMRKNDRKTPEEIDRYYDEQDVSEALLESYHGILKDVFRKKADYKESIPVPIKPETLFISYLFVRDNLLSEGLVKPHSQSYVSKYRSMFDEVKMSYQQEVESILMS